MIEFSSFSSHSHDRPPYKPPVYVGGYRFGNLTENYMQMNLTYKPKWIHRQFAKMFLGLYWFDNKEENNFI